MNSFRISLGAVASACLLLAACGGGSSGTGTAGTSGGTAGNSGVAGNGTPGTAGTSGGTAGSGQAGTSGTAGTTGTAGQGSPGAAGSGVAGSTSGTAGAQGTAGSGGTQGSAGTSGGRGGSSGGSAGAGGTGGAQGSAGTSGGRGGSSGGSAGAGAGGTGGSGGTTTGTGGAGGSAVSCASLPFCDTFESGTVGGAPSSTNWTIVNGGNPPGTTATIDSMGAHGSSKSVKITTSSRFWLRNSTVIGTLGNVVHARFYLRFGMTLPSGHSGIFATDPSMLDIYTDQPQLRFGVQDQVFHWNTDTDAANIPDVGPQGDALSFKPTTNTWYCIELTINKMNGHLAVSIDGQDQPGLAEDGTATMYVDQSWIASSASIMRYATLAEFNIGWVPFNGGAMTLWFDDVALSSSTIGCN